MGAKPLLTQAMPARRGMAMGVVTATYAVGATLFSKIFDLRIQSHDYGQAMNDLAIILVVTSAVVVGLLTWSRATYRGPDEGATSPTGQRRVLWVLWLGYGSGSAAGLMAIGHATGLVAAAGAGARVLVLGAMLIGIGNACGGAIAGWLTDRWSIRGLLSTLPAISAAVLLALIVAPNPVFCIVALCLLGLAYGAIIAVYPAALDAAPNTRVLRSIPAVEVPG